MIAYMGTVIVILLNILIGQMSTTYTQAKRVARLEYDVDRILLLTRMERCLLLVCKRHGMGQVERVCVRDSEYHFVPLSIEDLLMSFFVTLVVFAEFTCKVL